MGQARVGRRSAGYCPSFFRQAAIIPGGMGDHRWTFYPAVVVALAGGDCTAPRPPPDVRDPDPSVKIPSYKKAVREKDRRAVPQLVEDLDSDDPAVRLYAIGALERMTGDRFGYVFYEGEEQRRPAVDRWRAWLAGREKSR